MLDDVNCSTMRITDQASRIDIGDQCKDIKIGDIVVPNGMCDGFPSAIVSEIVNPYFQKILIVQRLMREHETTEHECSGNDHRRDHDLFRIPQKTVEI